MKKTNFDLYYEEVSRETGMAEKLEKAGAAWDIALKISKLREDTGISQAELARRLKTSQQQISRLESPSYEGHSLSMLRRIAKALDSEVVVTFKPIAEPAAVQEPKAKYSTKKKP